VITVWRLCKTTRVPNAFTGLGAAENPGRWNSLGTRLVYCAESRALAALEIIAHVEDKPSLAKAKFSAVPVELDQALIQPVPSLPKHWQSIPPVAATQKIGDQFVKRAAHLALKVPSAVVHGEFNYLINPAHPAAGTLKIGPPEPFLFDPRTLAKI
jgi:RES domain-containing protein